MYGVNATVTSARPSPGHAISANAPVGGQPVTSLRPRIPTWANITSVLICDEPDSAKHSLTRVLAAIRPGITLSSATGTAELLAVYAAHQPDLVLIGVQRGRVGEPDPAQQLLRHFPAARVIVFGSPTDARSMIADIAHGARGLLLWEPNEGNNPARTRAFTLPRVEMPRQAGHRGGKPTDRELQILRGMSEGHSNGEIGRELFLSEDTVKTHARRLFQKLGARDRAHAVALGMRFGLVA